MEQVSLGTSVPDETADAGIGSNSIQFGIGSRSQTAKKPSTMQKCLNSANEIQIKDLTSKINLLVKTIQELTLENKTLKTGFSRQAAALQKYEGVDADFPRVLSYHQNEVKYLQHSLRKAQNSSRKYDAMCRDLNVRILNLENRNRKLQKLVDSAELEDRQQLQRCLTEANRQLAKAHDKLVEHGRQFDLLQKNHVHQMGTIQNKLNISDARVYDAEQELYRLADLIQQKDRVISYLRMRSRHPGLEPPLHKKVMEEFKPSYKYFHDHEERAGGDTATSVELGIRYNSSEFVNQSPELVTENLNQDLELDHQTENHENFPGATSPEQYCFSPKSNDTYFSEELARHSRERNLDVPCIFSDGEEEDGGQLFENNDVGSGNGTTEAEISEFEKMHPKARRSKSSSTYVLFKNDEDVEQFNRQEYYVMDIQSGDEQEEFFGDTPLSTSTNFPESQPGDGDDLEQSPHQTQRSRIPLPIRRGSHVEVKFTRFYGNDDPDDTDEDEETPEQGQESREDNAKNYEQNQSSYFYSDEDHMTRYSEEEFYDSGHDCERNEGELDEDEHFSVCSESAKSRDLLPNNQKFYNYTGQQTCNNTPISDDSQDELDSTHDAISNTQRNSSVDEHCAGTPYGNSACQSNASRSTANSNNSLVILHALRPKGPGPTEETPSDSREQTAESFHRETLTIEGDPNDLERRGDVWYIGQSSQRSDDHFQSPKKCDLKVEVNSTRAIAKEPVKPKNDKDNVKPHPRPIKKTLVKQSVKPKPRRFI